MGTKMGPSYANLFVGYIENQFFKQFNGTKPELYGRYNDDCIGSSSSREELDHFITSVLKLLSPGAGKFPKLQLLFLTSNFQSMVTAYLPVCTTNLQIPTVICCIHPLILPMSKTPSRSLNFLDFGVYVVMTPIFPTNQRKCVISSRIVAILILLSTQLRTPCSTD